jgi:hypothetical protein
VAGGNETSRWIYLSVMEFGDLIDKLTGGKIKASPDYLQKMEELLQIRLAKQRRTMEEPPADTQETREKRFKDRVKWKERGKRSIELRTGTGDILQFACDHFDLIFDDYVWDLPYAEARAIVLEAIDGL